MISLAGNEGTFLAYDKETDSSQFVEAALVATACAMTVDWGATTEELVLDIRQPAVAITVTTGSRMARW